MLFYSGPNLLFHFRLLTRYAIAASATTASISSKPGGVGVAVGVGVGVAVAVGVAAGVGVAVGAGVAAGVSIGAAKTRSIVSCGMNEPPFPSISPSQPSQSTSGFL